MNYAPSIVSIFKRPIQAFETVRSNPLKCALGAIAFTVIVMHARRSLRTVYANRLLPPEQATKHVELANKMALELNEPNGSTEKAQDVILLYNILSQRHGFTPKHFQGTPVKVAQQMFLHMAQLLVVNNCKELDLSESELSGLSSAISLLRNLKTLDLLDNRLETLPDSIGDLTGLQHLYIQRNLLNQLPASICKLKALQTLALNRNNLTKLPDAIGNLTALQTLELWGNRLTEIPVSIGNLTALQHLSLDYNKLTQLPASMGNLTALQRLSLEDNILDKETLKKLRKEVFSKKTTGIKLLETHGISTPENRKRVEDARDSSLTALNEFSRYNKPNTKSIKKQLKEVLSKQTTGIKLLETHGIPTPENKQRVEAVSYVPLYPSMDPLYTAQQIVNINAVFKSVTQLPTELTDVIRDYHGDDFLLVLNDPHKVALQIVAINAAISSVLPPTVLINEIKEYLGDDLPFG